MVTADPVQQRYSAPRLAAVLADQGRFQRWLARQVGVHESMISKLIKGERTLNREQAERVATILGVPFFVLFELHERSEIAADVKES